MFIKLIEFMRKFYVRFPDNMEKMMKFLVDHTVMFLKKLPRMFVDLLKELLISVFNMVLSPIKGFMDMVKSAIDKIKKILRI